MGLIDWLGWPLRGRSGADVTEPGDIPTKDDVVTPRTRFQGEFSPENLAFDSNLQEFAQRVAYICGLESAGKITPNDAHGRITGLYRDLERTHGGLGIGEQEPPS